MPAARRKDWRADFGLEKREPPNLYVRRGDVAPTVPQGHLLTRAFVDLEVDGILCSDHTPLIYFKLVKDLTFDAVSELHRRFWNHGGAPVLVLISDQDVHVYSAMTRPTEPGQSTQPNPVAQFARVAEGLKAFITMVEAGEFFHYHQKSFDPSQRVDRTLLKNLMAARQRLRALSPDEAHLQSLDALLCRLVFTCYLFDRAVIGKNYLKSIDIEDADHLRVLLALPHWTVVRAKLYRLFEELRKDFNGDLFSTDLAGEKAQFGRQHLSILNDFFQGTDLETGQRSFWPYDFKLIPIETISAIYEHFLSDSEERSGAFYTPRFLAEIVLDTALDGFGPLLGRRFLDPACGSGIFLVALFNRMADEWRHANPDAKNDRTASELMRLLKKTLWGVDVSPIACRITAFSLYLAYLDQLSPRDIQALQKRGNALPRLVAATPREEGNITCADFFADGGVKNIRADLIIGNPPWGSIAGEGTAAAQWCASNDRVIPDNQIAVAFAWKAPEHVEDGGRICFVLPHGFLFNHNRKSVSFQSQWHHSYSVDRVLNLADMQRFLFETAEHPSVVIRYRPVEPSSHHRLEYWCPKADWTVTHAEIITIGPQDRSSISIGELQRDLDGPDAPQLWNRQFWATTRDVRMLDRLSDLPRLRDVISQSRETERKRWLIAEGFQPVGRGDDPAHSKSIELPSRRFIEATSTNIDLFLLPRDTQALASARMNVRSRSNKNTIIFKAPHVLVAKGFTRVAFADFDVSFQHALRGIQGTDQDRNLLAFLTAYLRSDLARYYLFHTSNWGVGRQEVHVEELLRLPFALPADCDQPKRAKQIVNEVARIVDEAARAADSDIVDRSGIVHAASTKAERLVQEYFDVDSLEKKLVDDTINIIIPSTRPTRARKVVPTLEPATPAMLSAYLAQLCEILNDWSANGPFMVRGHILGSRDIGVGIATLEKVRKLRSTHSAMSVTRDVLQLMNDIRTAFPQRGATLDIVRGLMAFEGNRLYIAKPIGQRYWSATAAINDADEIATTILMTASGNQR